MKMSRKRFPFYSTESAKQGDKEAQYRVYQCYTNGNGVHRDNLEADKWLEKSIANGYGPAMFEKGNHLLQKGDENNSKQAFVLFENADKLGYAPAKYRLAYLYLSGYVVERDIDKAFSYYKKYFKFSLNNPDDDLYNLLDSLANKNIDNWDVCQSALAEDSEALFQLGCEFWRAAGQSENQSEAYMWSRVLFEAASAFGNLNSVFELGRAYWFGYGTAADNNTAFALWEYAANKGNAPAMSELGQCYTDMNDFEQAFEWYLKAARGGDDAGRIYVSECYIKGQGVEQNIDEAIKWLKDLIENNHVDPGFNWNAQWVQCAYYYLGGIYSGQFGDKYKDETLQFDVLEKGVKMKDRFTQRIAYALSAAYDNQESKYYNPQKAKYYAGIAEE